MIFALPAGLMVPISFLGTSQFGKALSPWGHVESSSFQFFCKKTTTGLLRDSGTFIVLVL